MVRTNRRQNVHFPSSDLGEAIAPDGERRPQPFLRRPHGRHAGACGRHVAATLRPRSRAGGFPSSCDTLSIHRHRWCAGRCAARQRPERLQSFGTITLVLAMALQLAPSTNKVQLTPHARLAQPPRSLTPGCSLWMAGDHWTLRWKLFLMAAKQQHLAAAWRRAGARAACHAHASVCAQARRGPRPRSGRRLVVELTDHRYLAGPPGPTAELGGLWSPWVSYRVGV